MSKLNKHLEIGSSPHITDGTGTNVIMRNVFFALLPVTVFAVYAFGTGAALVLMVATLSCVLTEHWLCRWTGKPSTVGDWSVSITGLLYGLTLPPDLPLWMVFIGGVFGVAVAKFLFGGLGMNAFNPALVGRAFLQAAFPQAMTHWQAAVLTGSIRWRSHLGAGDAVLGANLRRGDCGYATGADEIRGRVRRRP